MPSVKMLWVYVDYPFIRVLESYARLASKKGIAVTAGIAAAIVGASFLIWLIPQSSPGTFIMPPRGELEIINDVYSRHNSTATSVDTQFEQWNDGTVTTADMQSQIGSSLTEVQNLQKELADARPAQEWQESFGTYTKALDSYTKYLNAMEAKVQSGDKSDSPELDGLKKEWQGYVDSSVSAMPIGK
jgi:hypothetical protein